MNKRQRKKQYKKYLNVFLSIIKINIIITNFICQIEHMRQKLKFEKGGIVLNGIEGEIIKPNIKSYDNDEIKIKLNPDIKFNLIVKENNNAKENKIN